jgi:hypothetical protein
MRSNHNGQSWPVRQRQLVINLIAERDAVVIQWMGKGTTKTGQTYNDSYCYVVQIENGRIIRGTAYLDTELVRAIWWYTCGFRFLDRLGCQREEL